MATTYYAKGLLEYRLSLNAGGAVIRICFSGGSMSCNGIIPATYTTDNPAIRNMIENSPQYLEGRIRKYENRDC